MLLTILWFYLGVQLPMWSQAGSDFDTFATFIVAILIICVVVFELRKLFIGKMPRLDVLVMVAVFSAATVFAHSRSFTYIVMRPWCGTLAARKAVIDEIIQRNQCALPKPDSTQKDSLCCDSRALSHCGKGIRCEVAQELGRIDDAYWRLQSYCSGQMYFERFCATSEAL